MATGSKTVATSKFTLNNGTKMPTVGLGTYRIRNGDVIMKVVDTALAEGYRMFDTAAAYHNEHHIKNAFQTLLPKYGLEREDVFITTKLPPSAHGKIERVKKAYQSSLDNLGLEYADLYLIHFPGTQRIPHDDKRNAEYRKLTWDSMVELYDSGTVNAIGVSNFTVRHLTELLRRGHGVVPAVNQVEWHPYYYQVDLLQFCNQHDIVLQAYCSLGGASSDHDELLKHPVVTKIANRLSVTNAQVLLRWAVQQDVSVIPKSTNADHIRKNISLNFELTKADTDALNGLGPNKAKYAWDPSDIA